jgi:hypothetical protein
MSNGAVQENGDGLYEFEKHNHEKEYPKDAVPEEDKDYKEATLAVCTPFLPMKTRLIFVGQSACITRNAK